MKPGFFCMNKIITAINLAGKMCKKRKISAFKQRIKRSGYLAKARMSILFLKKKQKAIKLERLKMKKINSSNIKSVISRGYDPELVYVECGRCGAPVVWEKGRSTALFESAGIDPLELDASCILVTNGCSFCGSGHEYHARVFRMSSDPAMGMPPAYGNA